MGEDYLMGWAAITRLLARGKSLSGLEPNSMFLNLGSQPSGTVFADASAATGFNYTDDSRALGFTDWDFDGDVDTWMLNRTAPAVRFLKNNQTSQSGFLAFALKGTTSNRNAIGARITLTTTGASGEKRQQIRTVSVGGTYLSQSSRWQHFGLGDHRQISSITISWPGGNTQSLSGIQPGTFYTVEQNEPANKWTPPEAIARTQFPTGALVPPPLTNTARIVLGNRSLFPPIKSQLADGRETPPDFTSHGAPRFVALWSATCETCKVELAEWSRQKPAFDAAGLPVLLLNVDPREDAKISSQAATALEIMSKVDIKFPLRLLPAEEVGSLDAFQQALSAIHLQLITPTSFLLDSSGRVAVMYRGSVAAEQVIRDMQLLTLPESAQPDSSVPYPGPWWKLPLGADPSKIALLMHDEGLTPQAIRYLEAEIAAVEAKLAPQRMRPLFELYFSLARLNFKLGKVTESIAAYQQTLQLSPDHLLSAKDLGRILYDRGENAKAIPYIEKAVALEPGEPANRNLAAFAALRLGHNDAVLQMASAGLQADPNNAALHFASGLAYQSQAKWKEALKSYEQAVRIDKQQHVARNNLAWILATADDPSIRKPDVATRVVTPLLKASGPDLALFLRTAAAAKAAAGDFPGAIGHIGEAMKLAPPELAASLKKDLALYQKGMAVISQSNTGGN